MCTSSSFTSFYKDVFPSQILNKRSIDLKLLLKIFSTTSLRGENIDFYIHLSATKKIKY